MSTFLNGKITYIAGFGLLLVALGQFIGNAVSCFDGTLSIQLCIETLQQSGSAIIDALIGLGFVGIRRAIGNSK